MYLFKFGKYPDVTFRHDHRRQLPCFEEIKWECRKLSFNDMLHPIAFYDEISSSQFHCLESSCRCFQRCARLFFPVEFDFVIKYSYSNISVICGPKKIPTFILASIILEIFCLKWAIPSLYLSIALTHIYTRGC